MSKPVALVANAIMDCTTRGAVVLDSFWGSGTMVIAAERTGRRCFGLEIDPLYVDTVIRRWQTFTRDNARHASSGRLFREMEAEVEGSGGGEKRAAEITRSATKNRRKGRNFRRARPETLRDDHQVPDA